MEKPTPEEIEAALAVADLEASCSAGYIFPITALQTLAAAYRSLRDSQPRTWTAETIKDAPDGWYYIGDRLGWESGEGLEYKLLPLQSAKEKLTEGYTAAVGPIKQPWEVCPHPAPPPTLGDSMSEKLRTTFICESEDPFEGTQIYGERHCEGCVEHTLTASLSKPPASWLEYAARLAPLLPEWAAWVSFDEDGDIQVCEFKPDQVRGTWQNGGKGRLLMNLMRPKTDAPWGQSLLRITRTPDGVTVAPASVEPGREG